MARTKKVSVESAIETMTGNNGQGSQDVIRVRITEFEVPLDTLMQRLNKGIGDGAYWAAAMKNQLPESIEQRMHDDLPTSDETKNVTVV